MAEETSAQSTSKLITALKEGNKEIASSIKESAGDTFKPFVDQITAPLNNIKAGIETLPGGKTFMKLGSVITKPFKSSASADKEEVVRDKIEADGNKTLMEDIRDGILGISQNLLAGVKSMGSAGLYGIGMLAGLVAAPFALLTGFFTQLGLELAQLKKAGSFIFVKPFTAIKTFFTNLGTKFSGSKVATYFDDVVKGVKTFFTTVKTSITNTLTPKGGFFGGIGTSVTTFFSNIKTSISNSKALAVFDDVVLKTKGYFGRVGTAISNLKVGGMEKLSSIGTSLANTGARIKEFFKPVTALFGGGGPPGSGGGGIVNSIKGIFNPVKSLFNTVKSSSALMKPVMDGFKLVQTFAKTIGTVLGKIFLPITILMSVYDAVTGFMSGYKDAEGGTGEKIFAGVKEGLAKVIENLIGLPLDMLKSGLTWLIKTFFGESKVTESLEAFSFKDTIGKLVRLPFDMITKAVAWVKTLFTDPKKALQELWVGLVGKGGLLDILFFPLNKAVDWVKGIFGWSEPEGESFSIGQMIKDAVEKIFDWFAGLLDFDFASLVKNIPGAGKVLDFLGFGEDTPQEALANKQKEVDKMSADVAKESWYEGKAQIEMDREELKQAMAELEMMKMQMNGGGGEPIIINNTNTDNSNNSSHTTPVAMKDATPPTGTLATAGF